MNGRPDIMPNFPVEDGMSWIQTFSFRAEDAEAAQARLVRLPSPGRPIVIKPRSWFTRLFSWPWRPHHNSKVWTATGEISFFEKEVDDERARFKVYGEGRLKVGTART